MGYHLEHVVQLLLKHMSFLCKSLGPHLYITTHIHVSRCIDVSDLGTSTLWSSKMSWSKILMFFKGVCIDNQWIICWISLVHQRNYCLNPQGLSCSMLYNICAQFSTSPHQTLKLYLLHYWVYYFIVKENLIYRQLYQLDDVV